MTDTKPLNRFASKWNQVTCYVKFAILFFVISTVMSGCFAKKDVTLSDSGLSEEQLAVYGGFLDALSSTGFEKLADRTIVFDTSEIKAGNPCLQGLQLESPGESTRAIHPLNVEIIKGRKLELVDSRQQAALIKDGAKAVIQAGDSNEYGQTTAQQGGWPGSGIGIR
jgi:hypothetical protein